METISKRAPGVAFLVAGLFVVATSAAEQAEELPELDAISKLLIAPASELKVDPRADAALTSILEGYVSFTGKIRNAPANRPSTPEEQVEAALMARARFKHVNLEFIDSLIEFIEANPTSMAALKAELVLAETLETHFITRKCGLVVCGIFHRISKKYPETKEAALASLRLLEVDLRELQRHDCETGSLNPEGSTGVRECLTKIRDAISVEKGTFRGLDEDGSPLGVAFKAVILAAPGATFAASFKILLGTTVEQLGQKREARRLYEEVLREYPQSPEAKDASLAIESLDIQEDLAVGKGPGPVPRRTTMHAKSSKDTSSGDGSGSTERTQSWGKGLEIGWSLGTAGACVMIVLLTVMGMRRRSRQGIGGNAGNAVPGTARKRR